MQEKPEALYVPAGHSVYVEGSQNGGDQSFRDRGARKKIAQRVRMRGVRRNVRLQKSPSPLLYQPLRQADVPAPQPPAARPVANVSTVAAKRSRAWARAKHTRAGGAVCGGSGVVVGRAVDAGGAARQQLQVGVGVDRARWGEREKIVSGQMSAACSDDIENAMQANGNSRLPAHESPVPADAVPGAHAVLGVACVWGPGVSLRPMMMAAHSKTKSIPRHWKDDVLAVLYVKVPAGQLEHTGVPVVVAYVLMGQTVVRQSVARWASVSILQCGAPPAVSYRRSRHRCSSSSRPSTLEGERAKAPSTETVSQP